MDRLEILKERISNIVDECGNVDKCIRCRHLQDCKEYLDNDLDINNFGYKVLDMLENAVNKIPCKVSIEFKNIDLSNISVSEQLNKVQEENLEFFEACTEYLTKILFYNISDLESEKLRNHVIEEFWDTVQSKVGYMDKINISIKDITAGYEKHLHKMESRGNKPRE